MKKKLILLLLLMGVSCGDKANNSPTNLPMAEKYTLIRDKAVFIGDEYPSEFLDWVSIRGFGVDHAQVSINKSNYLFQIGEENFDFPYYLGKSGLSKEPLNDSEYVLRILKMYGYEDSRLDNDSLVVQAEKYR